MRAEQYQLWERAPGYETRQPTSAPHSDRVDIFVNSVLADALASSVALTSWPVGSLVVKDGYSSGELELIAIMERREDEWFFAEYDDEGDSEFSGLPSTCTDCHTTANDRILAFDLPSGAAPDP